MAVRDGQREVLALMPPRPDSPQKATVYGSPAKFQSKKECWRVQKVASLDRLMDEAAREEEEEKNKKSGSEDGGEEDEEDYGGAAVQSYKKSQYWSKEVEEKLGLAGADPYGLLELEEKRWKATPEEIRKAYRRLVLTHHPDKKAAEGKKAAVDVTDKEEKKAKKKAKNDKDEEKENGEKDGGEEEEPEEEEEEDTEFKLLSAAWDLLGTPDTRRAYDSIDNFNDFLPTVYNSKKNGNERFFAVFGPPFARQSKFSTEKNVPQLGDADTPYEQVAKFYKFWTTFASWRCFDLLAEQDLKEAEDRE